MTLPYPLWFKSLVSDRIDVTNRRAREYNPVEELKAMGCWMIAGE